LVTGGAGFIGSHVTRKLLDRGYRVRVLDKFLYGKGGLREGEEHPELEIMVGDITDPEAVGKAVSGVRAVIALAALVGDAACDLWPGRTNRINYEATGLLVAACRKVRLRRLVFASSCSVYGVNGTGFLYEDSALNPVSLYARTRILSEELLSREGGDLEPVILRLGTVCGVSPRMRFDLMVNTMTACAVVRKEIRVTGAEQWRPHLHVEDAADAFVLAAETAGAGGTILNVGSDDENFTVGEIAEKVAQRVEGVRIDEAPGGGDPRSYRVGFGRVREVLGFRAKRTVDDAIDGVSALLAADSGIDFASARFHNAKWLSGNGRRPGAE